MERVEGKELRERLNPLFGKKDEGRERRRGRIRSPSRPTILDIALMKGFELFFL